MQDKSNNQGKETEMKKIGDKIKDAKGTEHIIRKIRKFKTGKIGNYTGPIIKYYVTHPAGYGCMISKKDN